MFTIDFIDNTNVFEINFIQPTGGTGGTANVHNSNSSFNENVPAGGSLELEDNEFSVTINGVTQTAVAPAMEATTINITIP